MVSTNRKIAVNKGILPPIDRNSDLPDRTKNGKKIKENQFISNFKNCVHQQKKAPN